MCLVHRRVVRRQWGVTESGRGSLRGLPIGIELVRGRDLANLVLDRGPQVYAMTLAGVLAHGGFIAADGRPDMGRLRAVVAERIAGIPRLNQRYERRALRSQWVPHQFELNDHVRLLPAINSEAELARVCDEVAATHLPLDRPLWQILVVPGLAGGRTGIIVRLHHAIADGLTMVRIVGRLFDEVTAAESVEHATGGGRDQVAAPGEVVFKAARENSSSQLLGTPHNPAHTCEPDHESSRRRLRWKRVARTQILGPLAGPRTTSHCSVEFIALKAGATRLGASVNDAILTAVAGADHLGECARGGERDLLRGSAGVRRDVR